MNDQGKKSNNPQIQSVLETMREIGSATGNSLKNELLSPIPESIGNQLWGGITKKSFSGEIMAGETLEMREVYTGKREIVEQANQRLVVERTLFREEQVLVSRRTAELRIQIEAIQQELLKVAKATPKLSREIKIASLQVSADSSEYERKFLEHLFESIKSYRKKIQNASVWLETSNRRAAKKNSWAAKYKKHGAKYLLSSEHYLTRSAA